MANAFDVLARDHAEVKDMLTRLELGAVRQSPAASWHSGQTGGAQVRRAARRGGRQAPGRGH